MDFLRFLFIAAVVTVWGIALIFEFVSWLGASEAFKPLDVLTLKSIKKAFNRPGDIGGQ